MYWFCNEVFCFFLCLCIQFDQKEYAQSYNNLICQEGFQVANLMQLIFLVGHFSKFFTEKMTKEKPTKN